MRRKLLGLSIMVIGLIFIMQGTHLATLVVDDYTPPNITWTCDSQPVDAQTYQTGDLTYVTMWAMDRESNIDATSAFYILDDGTPIKLDLQPSQPKAYPMAMAFEKTGLSDPSIGTHTFKFQVKNGAGITGEQTGTFQISDGVPPTELQGTWHINDVEITLTNQEFDFTTTTLTFKFVRTLGVDDAGITCRVDWDKASNPEQGDMILEHAALHTWTGTRTFIDGSYVFDLIASDGTQQIALSAYGDIGSEPPTNGTQQPFHPLQILGAGMIVAGALITYRSRKAKADK